MKVNTNLHKCIMVNSYEILGGRNLSDTNYTNWQDDEYAGTEPKCMQLLSGTIYNGTWMPFECDGDFNNRALCQLK